MKNNNLYLDLHVIQSIPPSLINRDDTGSPKTAIYGGAVRARISSQAWKRAMRLYFRDLFTEENIGLRTKKVIGLIADEVKSLSSASDKEAENKAKDALSKAGLSFKENDDASALFFISQPQIRAIANLAVQDEADKKQYTAAIKQNPGFDMILFGRMVAADPSLNYDAAAQVAHSISTHAVQNEYDYFTAVDDCAPEDNHGAGHLGTVEFNSATLYRYATVNVREVLEWIGSMTPSVVRGFAEAFIRSMPTGKQSTFANRTLPDAVYIALRRDQPVNLCGAFEKPVQSSEGYTEKSIRTLADYAADLYANIAGSPEKALVIGNGLESLCEEKLPLEAALNRIAEWIKDYTE